MKNVAVLCCSKNSAYHNMPGVIAYDQERDARTFSGGLPVVAHPPCRAWSAFCRHQAKPAAGERELGFFCVDVLRREGGVLEHPAFSLLFEAAGLPEVGQCKRGMFTIEVWQSWFGYPVKKRTWLCFSGVNLEKIKIPFCLTPQNGHRAVFASMSKRQRSETVPQFARWLVALARQAK